MATRVANETVSFSCNILVCMEAANVGLPRKKSRWVKMNLKVVMSPSNTVFRFNDV